MGVKQPEGNQLADCQARKAALYETPSLQTPLIWTGPVEQEKPQYTEEELERYEKRGAQITDKGWLQSEDGRLISPENANGKFLRVYIRVFIWVQRVLTKWLLVCLKVKI